MDFRDPVPLGRTGLMVGRLGVASGYGAPPEAIEMAFARGCNYFTWGTFIRGRSPHMATAIRRIVANGQRDKLVLSMFSYAHQALLTEKMLARGLRAVGLDHAEMLILGYFSRRPRRSVIDGALRLKEKGLAGEEPPSARDCYRFALSHPAVDVCMTGARTVDDMRENLRALDRGPLDADEMTLIRRIGDHLYGKPRALARQSGTPK